MSHDPRILIFTGDGKGKTTAALGMALRASGHGMRVCILQFIKNDATTGELAAAADMAHIDIIQTGQGFLPKPGDARMAGHRAAAVEALHRAEEIIAGGEYPVIILDEICVAVSRGLLEEPRVIEVLAKARPEACIVLTGRDAPPGLVALADTVTEMRVVKHGYHAGRKAQKGVEW